MRIIQKQISLEPMTSRLPSVWPAYKDNNPNIYYFDEKSLINREWQYTSNWGMVPVNIVVSPKPYSSHTYSEYTVIDGCHCYGNSPYDELCEFVLSFENLSKWYYFFNEYYNLLKQYSHCDRVYTSAEDYYNYESLTKYADQMKYGADKQTYLDLDEEFAEKGGRVEVQIYNKDTASYSTMTPEEAHDEFDGDRMSMTDVYDIGFFKWICENVVPSFTIPMIYRNYWKKDTLYYPDVIKWLQWFKDRVDIYENASNIANFKLENGITEPWDCKADEVTDCCDCEEYFGRGGKRIYGIMEKWYKRIQSNILKSVNSACTMPTVILPTELQVSIDDLGEFSIFSKEYELGNDYRVAHYGDSANTYGGTVTVMDGNSIYLDKDDAWGYAFSPDYMEKYVSSCSTCDYVGVFYGRCPKCGSRSGVTLLSYSPSLSGNAENAWVDYTDRYVNSNMDDFSIDAKFYTYDEFNKKYTSSGNSLTDAKNELEGKLTKKYPLIKNDYGWFLIDGLLYEIKQSEYGNYDKSNPYLSNAVYMVFREPVTNTPYTYVNGKQVFADFYPPTNVFYFPFFLSGDADFKTNCSGKTFNINNYQTFKRFEKSNTMYYIEYDSKIIPFGVTIPDSWTIDGNEYSKVNGYAYDDYGNTLYCLSDSVWYYSDFSVYGGIEKYSVEGYNEPKCEGDFIILIPIMDEESGSLFTIRSVDEITGRTVSKINDLRLYNVLTDDIGNTIEGIYDLRSSGATNHQPPEGTELELIYQVGNTANITRFSQTKDDMDDIIEQFSDDMRNYFVGDIITDMAFYYKDYSDNIVEETIFYVKLNSGGTKDISSHTGAQLNLSGYTSLLAIQKATDVKNNLEKDGKYMQDDIYCDIRYYIGATLCRKEGEAFILVKDKTCSNYGVEYTETVRFVKTNWEYYLKKSQNIDSVIPSKRQDPCKHSVSYPIYVYVLTQDLTTVEPSQYNTVYSVPMADFKFEIDIFSGETDTFSQKYQNEMTKYNNMQVYPTYREEYRLGISSMENVDSDIYIDRGINAAFEKHIKLGEVTSLEALEQYGLTFFKIMDS